MVASKDIMNRLHEEVAADLLKKIQNGEATAQELNAAIKFLQNNSIQGEREPGNSVDKLTKILPQFEDEYPDA